MPVFSSSLSSCMQHFLLLYYLKFPLCVLKFSYQEMFEVAKKLCSFCERLVHDEHLQHQGWAAIMANLDDCTLSYQKLLMKFDTAYASYQQDLEEIKVKLSRYVMLFLIYLYLVI